jgi:hypothetical protein
VKLESQVVPLRRRIVAVLGVVLLIAFGVVQAAHFHPGDGLAGDSHCTLCAVAHAPAAVPAVSAIPAPSIAHHRPILLEPSFSAFEISSFHYGRPPPSIA